MIIYRQDGNTALEQPILTQQQIQPQEQVQPQPQEQVEAEPQRRSQPKTFSLTKWQKIKILGKVVVFTSLAFFMVARFAVVAQQNLAIIAVKNSIKEQQTLNADLEAKLAATAQLSNVQEQAEKLNMNFPTGDQVQYVSVTPYAQLVETQKEQQKAEREPSIVREIME